MSQANYAVVQNGIVTKLIIVDESIGYTMPNADVVKATSDTRIGGSWDGNVFTFVEPTPAPDTRPYDEKRSAEYPSIGDQLDKIYHDGIDEWKKVIKVTKDKYPKS